MTLVAAKSVLLKRHFGASAVVEWDPTASVISHFRNSAQAAQVFQSVGLKMDTATELHSQLSTGEQFQADIARLLVELPNGPVVVDEFCSALDVSSARQLCQGLCNAGVSGWVVASCCSAIVDVDGLRPQWLFDSSNGCCSTFDLSSANTSALHTTPPMDPATLLGAPTVSIQIQPCAHSVWDIFKRHHYKSEQLSHKAEANVALASVFLPGATEPICHGTPVGFVATILHAAKGPTAAQAPRRAHRTVVLPEWQGLGLGSLISDAVAAFHFKQGREYFGQTVHPRQVCVRQVYSSISLGFV